MEQTQAELPRLVALASRGEEVLITVEGRAVAKLTGLARSKRSPQEIEQWLAGLDRLRANTATGKLGMAVEDILEEDRGNGNP
jgi:antitoxin (DNA-binding transcriptional repressor) of toxin-antitoxin stability system